MANPTVRIRRHASGSAPGAFTLLNAELAFGASMGIPVLNMLTSSGVNSINQSTLTRDGTHPTDWAFANQYGPTIAQFVQGIF